MIKTAIELLFDAQTDATLRGLLDEIDAAGLPSPLIGWGTRPHLSLLLGGAARDGLEEAVAAFGAEPLSVTLDGVGTFPGDKGIVYLAPVVTRALLDIHDAAHAAFGAYFDELDAHYLPGRWMPHCTQSVGLDPDQLADVVAVCRRAPLPLAGRLTRVAIHDVYLDPSKEGFDRIERMEYRAVTTL